MPTSRRHARKIRSTASICCREPGSIRQRKVPIDYATLKLIHVSCVVSSYALFFIRGVWMLRDSSLLRRRWVRIVPHVIDTLLLGSAITLALMLRQYPFVADWITAKVVALFGYIGLGMVALRFARTRRTQLAAWLAAQVVFIYIVAVALTRNPLPWMSAV